MSAEPVSTAEIESLVKTAVSKLANSYAPYSRYTVAAALLTPDGQTYFGVNVENASYGATICAERSAAAAMASSGGREIRAIAVVTPDGNSPCGICLQTLTEFVPKSGALTIVLAKPDGVICRIADLKDFLPQPFSDFESIGHS